MDDHVELHEVSGGDHPVRTSSLTEGCLARYVGRGGTRMLSEEDLFRCPIVRVLIVTNTGRDCALPSISRGDVLQAIKDGDVRNVARFVRWDGTAFRSGEHYAECFLEDLIPYDGEFPVPPEIDNRSR